MQVNPSATTGLWRVVGKTALAAFVAAVGAAAIYRATTGSIPPANPLRIDGLNKNPKLDSASGRTAASANAIATAASIEAKKAEKHRGTVSVAMPDGVYTGQVKDGNPDGSGVWDFDSGDHYAGQFKDGTLHGLGVYTWKNGTLYNGEFKNGTPNGIGVYTWKNGTIYAGECKDGTHHGQIHLSYRAGPKLNCRFERGVLVLSEDEQITQRFSTLFASLLAGTNKTGGLTPYSLQVLSKYLSGMSDAPLKAMGLELKFAAELAFLDPESAKKEVLMRLHSNGNAFIPFGNKDHAMLLGLHVTKDGIEARIYNSGEGLTLNHDSIGIKKKRKYQTCKTMLFEDMTPHTPKFKKILSTLVHAYTTCDTIDEVYALLTNATPLRNSGFYQSPQKSENCDLECIMALLLDRLGREDYDTFRRDLITAVYHGYAAQDRKDYVEGSLIRKETMKRLAAMKDHREEKTLTFANGDSYTGRIKKGFFHGRGRYTLANRTVYEGNFWYGKFQGQGKKTFPNGDFYEGDFENGRLWRGQGKRTYRDGTVYEGEFWVEKFQGKGKMTSPDGTVYIGNFVFGVYQEPRLSMADACNSPT